MAKRNSNTRPSAVVNVPAPETVVPGETVVPETVVPVETVVPAPDTVVLPAWAPSARYVTTVNNALCGGEAVVPAGAPVLISVGPPPKLSGTARMAAHAALVASMGQPEPVVLAAVALAETQWHQSKGRTPTGINPPGWLGLFSAKFAVVAPAPEAVVPQ